MTTLELWTQTPLAKAIAWALLDSLWEGAAIALLLAAVLFASRSPRARYAAACVALLAVVAAFAVTLARLWPAQTASGLNGAIALTRIPQIELAPSDLTVPHVFRAADLLPWLAPFWMLGVLTFHLRALAGWVTARRLRRSGVCCAAAEWTARINRLAARIRVSRPVTLFESSLADAPVVIGYLRPVILMPVGLLAGLPVAQVEAILAHELAHIRRQDYLVNLLQTFVEGLLFYHPAVWWISHQIRAERENCCDDLAVAVSGDVRQYAAALTALEQNRWTARELALAATGGNLVKRIHRLLAKPERTRIGFAPLASAIALTVVATAGLAAWQTAPAQKPQPNTAQAVTPQAAPVEATAISSDAQKPQSTAAPVADHMTDARRLQTLIESSIRANALHAALAPVAEVAAVQDQQQISQRLGELKRLVQMLQEQHAVHAASAPVAETAAVQQQQQQLSQTMDELSRLAEQVQQRATTASPYTKWLNQDVAYIITDQERAAYRAIETDAQRESFIEQFWQRRDPTPGTPENEFKDEHYRRIAYANEHFAPTTSLPGWKTDRGRIYITYGPPDEIEDHSSGGKYQRPATEGGGETTTFPFQQWRYRFIEGVGNNIIIEFVDPTYTKEYRMTTDPSEKDALAMVRPPAAQAQEFQRIEGRTPLSFISVGGDPQVTVEVTGGIVRAILEQNSIAGAWDFAFSVTSGGKTVANARDGVKLPAASAGQRMHYNCTFKLAAGSYTLNVAVKDPNGATQTKSVAFYVN